VYSIPLKRIYNGNKDGGDIHTPHRSPIKTCPLPEVKFNPTDKTLSFVCTDNLYFTYEVYDNMENVVCEGEVSTTSHHTEAIFLPEYIYRDFRIIIEINGVMYCGDIEAEQTPNQ